MNAVPASHALALVASLSVVLLTLRFRQRFERPYLRDWQYSWSMSAAAAGSIVAFDLSTSSSFLLRFLPALAAGLTTGLSLFWFTTVLRDLARLRSLSTREYRLSLIAALLFGVGAAIVIARSASPLFLFEAAAVTFAALTLSGALSIVRRRRQPEELPLRLFAVAITALAIARLWQLRGEEALFAFATLALSAGAALTMILVALEEERSSAQNAIIQVEHLAYHDSLTGLPNRVLLFDRVTMAIAHATRQRHKLAILFLDLDRFKSINDSLGHSLGDALLKLAAERVRGCVRREDTLARFGGDEFVVLMPLVAQPEDAARVAQKIIEALSDSMNLAGHDVTTTASVGIAMFPADGTDTDTLVKNADAAMYQAKEEGRESYRFYTPALNARTLELLELETALRRALHNDEFLLHYQPLVDLPSGAIYGLEALLRWQHPELGIIGPDRFLPTAEGTGLIVAIGNWVIREACRQARQWQRKLGSELVVSVNLSARQLQQPDLVDQVRSALNETSLRARSLELEITETTAMQDIERTIRMLHELKALGVRLSIDDFGTGYSSLSYLKRLPVDTLKLDQSFVREITVPEDGAIAKGVIAMAHSLDLKVVAEGVETLGQLEFLRAHSCDRLQGFLFSRPLPPQLFEKYFQKNARPLRVA